MAELNSLFMDAAETKAAILGEGFLYKFLDEGIMKDHFCVLTDKRIYVKGTYFHNTDGAYRIRKGDYTIDVKNVISTGFSTARFGGVFLLELFFAVFLTVLTGFFLRFVEIIDHIYFGMDSILWVCSILLTIGLIAVPIYYYFNPFKIFVIEYGSGKIAFLAFEYLEDDFRLFQRQLYKAKDALSSAASDRTDYETGEAAQPEKPEALKELSSAFSILDENASCSENMHML
ncbi:MAG: hypothetical protein HFH93_10970 [Lachnospiraceae bacterium]|nr:hypothetical protein [Lachnospiraceae bacterium]